MITTLSLASKADRSRRLLTQRETGAKYRRTERAESSMEETRVPVFPPEIISNILKLSYVREDGKPLFLRPKDSSDPAYFTNMSIDAMRSRPRAYNPNSNQQPPRTKHSAPAINLLLVSKSFRKEGYAQFYRENTFSFSDGDHSDEILENLDLSKRQHIHRISFESQWELKIDLYPDMSGDIEFEFAMDWGNFETKALRRLPNIETIELRVRCTARHGAFIKRFHGFTWRANTGEKF